MSGEKMHESSVTDNVDQQGGSSPLSSNPNQALSKEKSSQDPISAISAAPIPPQNTHEEKDATDYGSGTATESISFASDPYSLGRHRHNNVSKKQMKIDYPSGDKKKLYKFYSRQNDLIDQFLNSSDEERMAVLEEEKMGPKVRFAVNASFAVNFCLFIIQLYAAISTGSLSLFATAADAFMDLVSSFVMFVTSRMAARPSVYKYPVGRTRIETIGIILFCALMTTVAVQLIVESGRTLGQGEQSHNELQTIPLVFVGIAIASKFVLFCYCYALRRYPAAHVFFIDHRNDLAVNGFGLVMSIVGERFVWYLDPIGAILIGLLILVSWVANAFDQVWLLVGKSAPRDFLAKVTYVTVTHDKSILKVDTVRAYHAGQKYYVEVDIVMDEDAPLRTTHDISQALQRKLEGLGDVERAFVHVDYEDTHNVQEEHKPLYGEKKPRRTLRVAVANASNKMVSMLSPMPARRVRGTRDESDAA